MSEGARAGTSSSSRGPRSRLGGACAPGAAALDACVAHGARVLDAWSVVLGAQSVIFGAQSMIFGAQSMIFGAQSMVLDAHAAGCTVHGAQCTAHGTRCPSRSPSTPRHGVKTFPAPNHHPNTSRERPPNPKLATLQGAPSTTSPGGCGKRRRQRARLRCSQLEKPKPACPNPACAPVLPLSPPAVPTPLATAPRGQRDTAPPRWGARRGGEKGGGARLGDAPAPKAGLAGSRLQEGSSGLTNKLLTASPEAGGRKQALLL